MTILSLLRLATSIQRQLMLVAILVVLCCASQAATLMWDANSESNLLGYRVYVGAASRTYSTNWTTTNTTFTVTNVPVNGTNFFAVTAFDTDGFESEYSDEVSGVFTNRPAKVTGVRLAPVLTAQSAPTVNGPWSPEVPLIELALTDQARFFRLAITVPEPSLLMPQKSLRFDGSKAGKLPVMTPKPPRQGLPFPG